MALILPHQTSWLNNYSATDFPLRRDSQKLYFDGQRVQFSVFLAKMSLSSSRSPRGFLGPFPKSVQKQLQPTPGNTLRRGSEPTSTHPQGFRPYWTNPSVPAGLIMSRHSGTSLCPAALTCISRQQKCQNIWNEWKPWFILFLWYKRTNVLSFQQAPFIILHSATRDSYSCDSQLRISLPSTLEFAH